MQDLTIDIAATIAEVHSPVDKAIQDQYSASKSELAEVCRREMETLHQQQGSATRDAHETHRQRFPVLDILIQQITEPLPNSEFGPLVPPFPSATNSGI